MKKSLFILSFLCFLTGFVHAQNPTFETQVSSKTVGEDEPFRITYSIQNGDKISGFEAPNFKHFDQLQNSSSQSISIINGKTTRKLSYIFILRPTAVGRFTIPGAKVRINGHPMTSNPVTITVQKGSVQPQHPPRQQNRPTPPQRPSYPNSNPRGIENNPAILRKGEDPMERIKKNLFVKVEVDRTDVYVGQQITADYKLYTRIPASSKIVKVPSFSGFSTHDLDVGNVNRPETKEIDGKEYRVYTFRKTLMFPLQTGTQSLDPVQIENDVKLYTLEKSSGGRDRFDDFFDDPFFKQMFDDPFFKRAFGRGADLVPHEYKYNMSSPVVNIHVKPLPEEGKPNNFNGAVGHFSIQSKIDHSKLTTDDAVTLTVTISGTGNLDLLNSPQVSFPSKLESYDPKTEDHFNKRNPFGGSRTFTYILMPNATGDITIPSIKFSYFDPQAAVYKTIHTEAHEIHVSQGEKQLNDQIVTDTLTSKNTLYPIISKEEKWKKTENLWFGLWWHWLLMLLPVLLLLLLIGWKRKHDALSANQVLLKNKKANRVALKRLSLAKKYLKQDQGKAFYEEISHAIWGYLCDKLNIPLSELTKQKAEKMLQRQTISPDATAELFTLLDRCEMALYAGYNAPKKKEDTFTEAVKIISQLESKLKKKRPS